MTDPNEARFTDAITEAEASRHTFCLASPGTDEEFHAYLLGFDMATGIFRRAIESVDPATIRAGALREAAMAGWNACRTSIYAVCEDVTNEAERLNVEEDYSAGYVAGTKRAAKSIARGFNSMEALDDDNFCVAILALIDKEQDQ